MARQKKDSFRISCNMALPVYRRLKAYADDKGQTMTLAMERIITAYMDECEGKSKSSEEEK